MTKTEKLRLLSVGSAEERLDHLVKLIELEENPPIVRPQFANNHIHTTYSFSPYSPTAAIYFAREAGLQTAGIMDHDSIGGAQEFRRASELAGIAVTCGMECRVNMGETLLSDRRFNSPDQKGIAYMAIHSVMPDKYDYMQEAFAPLRERRNIRNRAIVQRINDLVAPTGVSLDFDTDVLPLSLYSQGGSVTERHLLWALSGKLLKTFDLPGVIAILEGLSIPIADKQREKLLSGGADLQYDLLGILKADLMERIYIPATDECLTLRELVKLSEQAGAILCYPYLGDVTDSITGDKRAQAFEDRFLDELFALLKAEGVKGITYMPSRNTDQQITRVQTLCRQYDMMEISGEDINSPGQSFICEKLADPRFSHLVEATWYLIEREKRG